MSPLAWIFAAICAVWIVVAVVFGAVTWVGGGEPKPPEGKRDDT